MNFSQLIIALSISLFSNFAFSQTSDSSITSKGINLTKDKKSIFIPTNKKVIIRTKTTEYKGIFNDVEPGKLYLDSIPFQTEDIEIIKFLSAERIKKGLIYLISAPVSLAASIGAFLLYWDNGAPGLDFLSAGLFLYTPVGLTTGNILLLKQKKFRLNNGWNISVVN